MLVDTKIENGVALITLNRPEAMNAYDEDMRRAAYAVWRRIREDDAINVAVITGAGEKAFCTGSDLKKTLPPKESAAELLIGGKDPGGILHDFDTDKPVIAAINGYALGGGLELALACDIRVCSENARLGLTEARVASVPGSGGIQRLPRTVGKSDAMLMLLTGDMIDSAEALRIGLVSRVFPQGDLMAETMSIAERIAGNGPLAVRAIKRLAFNGQDMPLRHALEVDKYMIGLLRDTEDRLEGRMAFREKRKPVYRGK